MISSFYRFQKLLRWAGRSQWIICVLLMLITNHCVKSNLIKTLPGSPPTDFKQYSGYFTVGTKKQIFYWFVESQHNPRSDPLVLWLSGGPGCSGIASLLTEWGPFMVNDDGRTLRKNPYSWNRNASVLTMDSPGGVGYSYAGDGYIETDDDQTAKENWEFLVEFFKKFPQYQKNDLYVTGESYGGIYAFTLGQKILEMQRHFHMNIKGIAVGNGCISLHDEIDTSIYYRYAHGMIDESKWQGFMSQCCNSNAHSCPFHKFNGFDSCSEFVKSETRPRDDGINPYNIYQKCIKPPKQFATRRKDGSPDYSHLSFTTTCINDTALTNYMNRPDVRQTLGIPPNLGPWAVCSDRIEKTHQTLYGSMATQARNILHDNIKVMLYYGDADMVCNFLLGQKFVRNLGLKVVSPKKPFYVNGQLGGFHTLYGNLHYVVVKGAGHMVPTDKPAVAYHILNSFLFDEEF